ncbi:MAG: hypothetical protein K9N55_07890 [Phycisphaerae bacterium]|nr:hypothetical protein [Phycisphaerae bacterium]
MSTSRYVPRIVCMCLLGAMWVGPAWAQDVLDWIPAESLAVVRVNQLDNTLGQVDKFLTGISPMGVAMPIHAQLGQALGSTELNGVDMNGSFALFAVAPEASTQEGGLPPVYPGVLIPVSDYDKFISGNVNLGAPDDHGVSAVSGPGSRSGGTPWLISIKAGNYALLTLGKLYPQILQYQEMMGIAPGTSASMAVLAGRLGAEDTAISRQAPVWIYGNVAQASSLYKPMVMEKFGQFKDMIADKVKEDSESPIMDMVPIFDMYGSILEMILDQTTHVSLVIDPQPDVLRLSKTISAVPGSDLAGMLAKDNSAGLPNRLVGFARDGAAMSFVGTIGDSWKSAYTKGIDLVKAMAGESMTPENAAAMKQMTINMLNTVEGPVAFSFSINPAAKPLFEMEYVIAIKDAETFKGLIRDSVDFFNKSGITDLYKGMGMQMDFVMDFGVATYKGVSIDSARLNLSSTQPDSPMGKVIAGMYGEGLDYRWALVDKIFAMAVGHDVESKIHKLIDQIQAGAQVPMGSEMRDAFAVLPGADKADFVLTYNYVRILNIVGAMGEIMGEQAPNINVPTTSHLSIAGWGGENRARFDVAIPKQHVLEMVSAFSALSQAKK